MKRLSVDSKVKNELLKREYKANLAAIDDSSAESIIAFQLKDYISKAFSELPDKISNTFIESRIKGMSYKEIADKNNLSVKVVEYHISQALKLFREKLKDFIMLLL
ncbi:RNA Polymerase Sigma-24 Subunit ECF Subfamily [Bacteroidales bacterium CF]|nr:RNA Polymerase Sigma-24 Subunit ECF Subfamily [Bacteroidales bacterium CF]